ncbi:MAG: flagellar basal-body rod protein FlgF [Desulfovibrionaceae bacterium]|nr:flagellar basal-body rod protein FlgF [Desulfovibrionaceae bacterium]MDD4950972.1 flagellar basal-body rod protein FlgF [Desulfovibrionaceae bacterium]
MRDSIFSALFGAMSNETRMDLISNNLANVNTTGYKKDKVAFHDTFLRFAHDYLVDAKPYYRDKDLWPRAMVMARPRLSEERIDFEQGGIQVTGNPLDLAISGDGFFKVRSGDGDFLTRNGSFRISSEGRLVTEQGYDLLGQGGPITVPQGVGVDIDAGGGVRAGGELVSVLDLVTVDNPAELEKVGANLYRIRPGGVGAEIAAQEASIEQGCLEKSNVEVVTEMVAMIETQRAFQIYQKMITGSDELDGKLISQVGRAT